MRKPILINSYLKVVINLLQVLKVSLARRRTLCFRTFFFPTNMRMRFPLLSLLLSLLFCIPVTAQDFDVTTDRALADYQAGETITFRVETEQRGVIEYTISYSLRTDPIFEGTTEHFGGTSEITYTLNQPGFITFEAKLNNRYKALGVSVSKEDVRALSAEPADFDDFWDDQKVALADISMDVADWRKSRNEFSDTYQFSLAQVDGRRVHGYVVIPHGDGPFPATLRIPAFGDDANLATPDIIGAQRGNCIAMSINIHNSPPDQRDRDAYEPNIITSPETIYYRYAILGAIRAMDYLETIDEWNGSELLLYGDSQGGGLSMLVAGIDQRPTHLIQSIAALSQHGGKRAGRPSGFPYYLEKADAIYQTEAEKDQVFEATKYYDAIFAARRFKGTSMHFASFLDDVCPPATAYAAYNQMAGSKIMLHSLDLYHSSPDEFINDRRLFLREHFEASRTPPFEFEPDTRSHFIDAGVRTSVKTDTVVQLAPSVGLDNAGPDSDWTFKWEMVFGPGAATFDNENTASTNVVFSDSGKYRLRLRVTDPYPEQPRKYWTLADEVTFDVSPRGNVIDTTSTGNPSALNETFNELQALHVSPNPTRTSLQLSADFSSTLDLDVVVRDLLGREVFRAFAKTDQLRTTVDVSDFPRGIYLLSLQNGTRIHTERVVVEQA